MKAMLLAAGLGTRLRPLTADRPKCMVSIGGRPIIHRDIDWLRDNGIDEIVVNLHHNPQVVVDSIGDGSAFGVRVAYSRETQLLGTAGGVLAARPLIGEGTFVVAYADNLFDLRLAAVIDEHERSGAIVTMTLLWRADVSSSGVALMSEDGWITDFQEKPRAGSEKSHWVNAGLLVCEPDVFEAIPTTIPSDLSRDVMPELARQPQGLHGHRIGRDERVMWIDTMDDLRATEEALALDGRTGAP
jgi:NDP-sugar pyrophosphorylase family protein